MDTELAKNKIQILVDKYEAVKSSGRIREYTEEETKKDFILLLFEALGWNVNDKTDVSAEESQSGGRVDYGFYLDGRIAFYLEAKKLSADLYKEGFARQAVRYSWNKAATWAVLSDFEGIKVFNAQDIKRSLGDKQLFDIRYTEYVSRFDDLWLLSKEAFAENALDRYAEKIGKKYQKVAVSDTLYKDLNECRELLTVSLAACNPGIKSDDLDEGVQKLLDRLIFLRVAEDRNVEPNILKQLLHAAESAKSGSYLYEAMAGEFRELDKVYNANLFSPHPFEKWEEFGGATEKVIEKLYGRKGYYEYDFKAMPADVLGTVYEHYLAHRLSKSKKGITLDKDAGKRKEQGIYYTPVYVVDYIVKQALQPLLEKCTTIEQLLKIKIIDPACGSGSFLIKALEVLTEKYKELGESGDESTKKLILKNNLYGIDLDEKAVEIARLNLSINSLDKKVKLPELTKNIKCGNSLISDDVAVLKKYFGVGYRAKQVFNWSEEFPEVFQQGGFDVVIGNPPYGAELSAEDQAYFKKAYDIGSTDTAILFIKKATENLKKGGVLGFIIPKAFCFASNYEKVRNLVWDDTAAIVDCGKVWTAVKLEQVIVLIKKENPSTTYESGVVEEEKVKTVGNIDKAIAKQFGFFLNGVSNEEVQVAQKMLKNKLTLNEIAINQRGAMLQKEIGSEGDTTVLGGAQIAREGIRGAKGKIDRARIDDEKAFIKPNAVLVQNIVSHIENPVAHIKIIAAIPPKESRYTILDTVNQLILEKQYSPYVIWAILNSHLLNWYAYRFIFGKAIRTMHFDNSVTSRIPIPDTLEGSETLGSLAAEALKLQEEQVVLEENSNVWVRLKNEIQKVQHQIDMEVYALYGLAAKDVTIVQKEPPAVEGELG